MTLPEWDDMPEPTTYKVIDWQDVYCQAQLVTQRSFKRQPNQKEILDIFKMLTEEIRNSKNGTFYKTIHMYCIYYYRMERIVQ